MILNAATSFNLILSSWVHYLHIIERIAVIVVSDTLFIAIYHLSESTVILKGIIKLLSWITLFKCFVIEFDLVYRSASLINVITK